MASELVLAPYWEQTLPLYAGRPVRATLADGRQRTGTLGGSAGSWRVWSEDGPHKLPLDQLLVLERV